MCVYLVGINVSQVCSAFCAFEEVRRDVAVAVKCVENQITVSVIVSPNDQGFLDRLGCRLREGF